MSLLFKGGGVTSHTALTDKEVAGIIDHADSSVIDDKLASGVGLAEGNLLKLPVATQGQVLKRGSSDYEASSQEVGILFAFDGGGVPLNTGKYIDLRVSFACTVIGITMLADGSPDSTQVDIRKGVFADFPGALTSIVGPTPPELHIKVGSHTGANDPTVMTDDLATFTPDEFVGNRIYNDTDGSQGIIIANTIDTVTVTALTGGTLDQWSTGDSYTVFMDHMEDNALSGWSPDIDVDDILECEILTSNIITMLTVVLKVLRR